MNLRLFLLGFIITALLASWAGSCLLYEAAELGQQVAPIEARVFAPLEIVTVGTGTAYENPARRGPSIAIGSGERVVLVDAGRAVCDALRLSAIPAEQPDTVYLTNLLPVNTVGLDDLIFVGWLRGREAPLRVVGPIGTRALVDQLTAAHASGRQALGASLELVPEGAQVEVEEIGGGWVKERDGLTIRAGELTGGPLPALAYRFEGGGRAAVISGTGWAHDDLVELARGADILVHESVFIPTGAEAVDAGLSEEDIPRLEREAALHTSLREVGKLATRARVSLLVLVRLQPPPFFEMQTTGPVKEHYDGAIVIPDDGETVFP